jgi:hypothetical protein
MGLPKSLNELNKRSWYRPLKVAFLLSFLAVQIVGFQLVQARTQGQVIAMTSLESVGGLLKEDMTVYAEMTDGEAGKTVYRTDPALWADYVANYKERYAADPVAWYPEYSEIQRFGFCAIAFLVITLFFEILRRAFYYVIFGTVLPRKRRRKRRKEGSRATEET